MKTYASHYLSPIGEMLLLASDVGLKGIYFCGQRYFPEADSAWIWNDVPLAGAVRALDAYFSGENVVLIPTLDILGTPFQQQVWRQLQEVSAGQTCSYGEIAHRMNAPKAVRAVGTAIGRNPISILVPCHRVIGQSGNLTGYAGGVERKAWLLAHEAARQPQQISMASRSDACGSASVW